MHVTFIPAARWGIHGHSDLQSFAWWKTRHITHARAAADSRYDSREGRH